MSMVQSEFIAALNPPVIYRLIIAKDLLDETERTVL